MCTLYAGIYRVALRLQRAAEARRSRMAASLVSVASHTITRIGIGVSGTSTAVTAAVTDPVTLPDNSDDSCRRSTAVAELHMNCTGEDQLKMMSSQQRDTSRQTTDDDQERGMVRNSETSPEDCDVSRGLEAASDRTNQQPEVTPLLERSVDNGRCALNNSCVFVPSTSGTDRSRLPVSRMTSKCRRHWLVVVPDDDDVELEESWSSSAAVDARHQEMISVRHSIDVGRPLTCDRTRWPRRSVFELPSCAGVSSLSTPAAASISSSCSDKMNCHWRQNQSADVASASDEVENVANDVVDMRWTDGQVDGTEHQQNESVGFDRLSANENQLTTEDDHVTSVVGKCDEMGADGGSGSGSGTSADRQPRNRNGENDATAKRDDVVCADKTVKILANRWRRRARSRFRANRRLAHLRHWKMQRHAAAQAASSSVGDRQLTVSRRPRLLSSLLSVTDVYDD